MEASTGRNSSIHSISRIMETFSYPRTIQPIVSRRKRNHRDAVVTMAYDDDCDNCVRFKRTVEAIDRGRKLRYVSLRDAERRGLLNGVPTELRCASFHLISAHGVVESGGAAIPTLVGLLGGGKRIGAVAKLPGAMSFLTKLYAAATTLHHTDSSRRESETRSDVDRNLVM